MRLATIQTTTGPRAAVLSGDAYIDLHATRRQLPPSVRGLLEGGSELLREAAAAAAQPDAVRYPASSAKLLAPVPDPEKIVCIGLNYRDHAAESGAAIPVEPVLFSKFATTLIGHGDAIILPPVSREVDYEAELVLVVGKKGRNIPAAAALARLVRSTQQRLAAELPGLGEAHNVVVPVELGVEGLIRLAAKLPHAEELLHPLHHLRIGRSRLGAARGLGTAATGGRTCGGPLAPGLRP